MAKTLKWGAPLGTVLFLYGILTLYQISLPGLYHDEALDVVPAMQLLQGHQPELVRQAGVQIFGRKFPIMAMDYVGAVHTYAAIPFFSLFGINTAALRLMTVTGGAVTIAMTYFWAGWLFRSRWIALAAALLLAIHPSYVFFVRQGVHVSSLMTLWTMAALLLLLVWHRTRAWWWLMPAALALGLGLSTKILFLWFVLALLAIYLVWRGVPLIMLVRPKIAISSLREALVPSDGTAAALSNTHATNLETKETSHPPRVLRAIHRVLSPVGQVACVVLAFALGASLLVVYNLQTGGTLEVLLKNSAVSQYGVQNTEYPVNLLTRLGSLQALLDGGHFWFLGGTYANSWYPAVFSLTAVSIPLVLLWKPGSRKYALAALYLLALVGLVLLQSPLTISGIWPTHLFILLPLLHVLIALGLYLLGRYAFPTKGLWLATVVLGLLTVSSVTVDIQYHDALRRTGGHGAHSDAVYRLASYLDQNGVDKPIAMDWGIKYNLQLLTQGRVNPVEIFQYTPEPNEVFQHWLYGVLTTSERFYLFHTPEHTTFPRFDAFTKLAGELGKSVRLETTVQERDGTPLYMVYSAR